MHHTRSRYLLGLVCASNGIQRDIIAFTNDLRSIAATNIRQAATMSIYFLSLSCSLVKDCVFEQHRVTIVNARDAAFIQTALALQTSLSRRLVYRDPLPLRN